MRLRRNLVCRGIFLCNTLLRLCMSLHSLHQYKRLVQLFDRGIQHRRFLKNNRYYNIYLGIITCYKHLEIEVGAFEWCGDEVVHAVITVAQGLSLEHCEVIIVKVCILSTTWVFDTISVDDKTVGVWKILAVKKIFLHSDVFTLCCGRAQLHNFSNVEKWKTD